MSGKTLIAIVVVTLACGLGVALYLAQTDILKVLPRISQRTVSLDNAEDRNSPVEPSADLAPARPGARPAAPSASQQLGLSTALSTRKCHWPPILYKRSSWKPLSPKALSATLENLLIMNKAFLNDSSTAFYVDAGIALGLYREGYFVSDGDLDIVFGSTKKELKLPSLVSGYKTSINKLRTYGQPYTEYRRKHFPTEQEIRVIRAKLCMLKRGAATFSFPVLDDPWVRNYFESYLGVMWFVRMPWKSDYHMLKSPIWGGYWKPCIAVVRKMDRDKDGKITEAELRTHVELDGMDMEQYEKQLSRREICRAVSKANWILVNGTRWKSFRNVVPMVNGETVPLWTFPECGK